MQMVYFDKIFIKYYFNKHLQTGQDRNGKIFTKNVGRNVTAIVRSQV